MLDASGSERALAERRMREINEAWEVLQDPARRRAYDAERLASGRRRAAPAGGPPATVVVDADDDLVDVAGGRHLGLPRHLPWVVLLITFGVIFVLSAYAGSGGSPADAPSTTLPAAVGACLDVSPGPSTTVVSCDGPHELEVVARVPEGGRCPDGAERRRLAADGLLDCVRPGPQEATASTGVGG